MPKERKRKRSHSRSRERHRERDDTDLRLKNMEKQIDNLTFTITKALLNKQQEKSSITPPENDTQKTPEGDVDPEVSTNKEEPLQIVVPEDNNEIIQQDVEEILNTSLDPEILEILGDDPTLNKESLIEINDSLKKRWIVWMRDGFPDEKKKDVIKKYPKKGEFYTEAPKINQQIEKRMTDIAKKRDKHFEETQSCVGSALSCLGAGISLLMDNPEDGVDQQTLLTYMCDAGKLMTDVFHQHSVARKSFITPLLNKEMKGTLDATKSDEWLYGNNFVEQVKEAKSVDKACAVLKNDDKPSSSSSRPTVSKNQGNLKYPPVKQRQMGNQYKHQPIKFRSKPRQYTPRAPTQVTSQTTKK